MGLLELPERLAFAASTARVRDCVRSLREEAFDWDLRSNGEAHRRRPYPMGFYADDPNLYYANGWGCHEHMFPHERWLVRRAALRARAAQGIVTAEADETRSGSGPAGTRARSAQADAPETQSQD